MALETPSPLRAVLVLERKRNKLTAKVEDIWVFYKLDESTIQQWKNVAVPGNKKGQKIVPICNKSTILPRNLFLLWAVKLIFSRDIDFIRGVKTRLPRTPRKGIRSPPRARGDENRRLEVNGQVFPSLLPNGLLLCIFNTQFFVRHSWHQRYVSIIAQGYH